jgi:hypothetical protein
MRKRAGAEEELIPVSEDDIPRVFAGNVLCLVLCVSVCERDRDRDSDRDRDREIGRQREHVCVCVCVFVCVRAHVTCHVARPVRVFDVCVCSRALCHSEM